jgi:hypothetical protein
MALAAFISGGAILRRTSERWPTVAAWFGIAVGIVALLEVLFL